jgi:hemerythrin
MPIIEWNVTCLLGIRELDKRHKHMVQLLNTTYDNFRSGIQIEQSVVDDLLDYADSTFKLEETMMEEISYPGLPEHREEHEAFTGRITKFKKDFKLNKNVPIELLWFLCNWVTHHLRETDAEFGRFVDIRNIHLRLNKETR